MTYKLGKPIKFFGIDISMPFTPEENTYFYKKLRRFNLIFIFSAMLSALLEVIYLPDLFYIKPYDIIRIKILEEFSSFSIRYTTLETAHVSAGYSYFLSLISCSLFALIHVIFYIYFLAQSWRRFDNYVRINYHHILGTLMSMTTIALGAYVFFFMNIGKYTEDSLGLQIFLFPPLFPFVANFFSIGVSLFVLTPLIMILKIVYQGFNINDN